MKLKKKQSNYGRKIIKALPVVLAVVFSFTFLFGLSVYKFFSKNITSALTPTGHVFMEEGYPTILYIEVEDIQTESMQVNKIVFKLFDIDGKKVITYPIPLDYEVDMPGRFGLEKISNAFAFGQLIDDGGESSFDAGMNNMSRSIMTLLGLKPERFIVVESHASTVLEKFWESGDLTLMLNKDFITELPHTVKSNFTFEEFLNISAFIRGLPSDRLIENPHLKVIMQNTEVIDQEIRELMLLSKVSDEGLSIALLNAADKPGLAAFGARLVANNGGRVVAVNNSDNPVSTSVLITDNLDSLTVRKLSHIFEIKEVITRSEAKKRFPDSEIDRADIVVVMGFDLASTLY